MRYNSAILNPQPPLSPNLEQDDLYLVHKSNEDVRHLTAIEHGTKQTTNLLSHLDPYCSLQQSQSAEHQRPCSALHTQHEDISHLGSPPTTIHGIQ